MLFNSFEFLFFFPVSVALFFLTPRRWQWLLLLVASYYFYMCWKPEYAILIMFSTLVDYWSGLKMQKAKSKKERKKYLIASLISNLGLLCSFKYFDFFNANMKSIFDSFNIFYDVPSFNLLLPVGISFYTFQSISYTVDVYRGTTPAEKHLGIFAVYVSFFPQLVAGPIERSGHLLPQFREKREFSYPRAVEGLRLMLWGMFKKVVIADRLALFVNPVYDRPDEYGGLTLIIATVFFAFQIYCDFSGYSDIAVGSAKVLGFDLMENFKRPYMSKSISEFWKRWHISLSTWFRDYCYIPLGGNRTLKWRWYYNLLITFILSGLWHGANWTFITWGALHGFYLVFSIVSKSIREKFATLTGLSKLPALQDNLAMLITFFLVCFAWIFFRANNIDDALYIVSHLNFDLSTNNINLSDSIIPMFGLIAILELFQFIGIERVLSVNPRPIRWGCYCFLIWSIIYLGVFNKTQFIYFQF